MALTDAQEEILEWQMSSGTPRLCVFVGGTGSGKSNVGSLASIGFSLHHPHKKFILGGTSIGAIKRNMEPEMLIAAELLGTVAKPVGQSIFVETGEFYMFGDPNYRSHRAVRGANAAGGCIDEAALTSRAFFDEVTGRLRTIPEPKLLLLTNADHPMNWLKRDVLDKEEGNKDYVPHIRIESTPYDAVEAGFLPQAYVDDMEARLTVFMADRFIRNQWVAPHGRCWPSMNEVPVQDWDIDRVECGVDEGFSNECAAVWFGRIEGTDKWVTLAEHYENGLTEAENSDAIAVISRKLDCAVHYLDPAAKMAKAMRQRGLFVRKANNSLRDGINYVEEMCKTEKLFVTNRAPNLLAESSGYIWDEEAMRDKPKKCPDHACDATRYWAYTGPRKAGTGWQALLQEAA